MSTPVYYEINPIFFYDSNDDGIGDIKGLIKKFKYFNYLGIQNLILPDILLAYTIKSQNNYKVISSKIGTMNDFIELLSIAKKSNIKVFIDLNVTKIKDQSFLNLSKNNKQNSTSSDIANLFNQIQNNLEQENVNEDNTFFYIDSQTKEIKLNWSSEEIIKTFLQIVIFWISKGVKEFVFSGIDDIFFEETKNVKNSFSAKNHSIKNFYDLISQIKKIDPSIVLIGKFYRIHKKNIQLFNNPNINFFDFVCTSELSFVGTHKKFGIDKISRFLASNLLLKTSKYSQIKNLILFYGSSSTGRIVSRWGNDEKYWKQSSKSLALLQFFMCQNIGIYYGEEIGMTNLGLRMLDNYQDETIIERKNYLKVKHHIKEKTFHQAQILQNPINSSSPMQWNGMRNAGFSNADHLIVQIPSNFIDINVKQQYYDDSSILSFYRKLVKLKSNQEFIEFINRSKCTINKNNFYNFSTQKIKWSNSRDAILIFSNFKNKTVKFKPPKNCWLLFSSYSDFKYSTPIRKLFPYETLVFYQNELILQPRNVFDVELKKIWTLRDFKNKNLAQTMQLEEKVREKMQNVKIDRNIEHWAVSDIIIKRSKNNHSVGDALDDINKNITGATSIDDYKYLNENTNFTSIIKKNKLDSKGINIESNDINIVVKDEVLFSSPTQFNDKDLNLSIFQNEIDENNDNIENDKLINAVIKTSEIENISNINEINELFSKFKKTELSQNTNSINGEIENSLKVDEQNNSK